METYFSLLNRASLLKKRRERTICELFYPFTFFFSDQLYPADLKDNVPQSGMKWKDARHNLAQTRLLSCFGCLFQIFVTIFFFVSSDWLHGASVYLLVACQKYVGNVSLELAAPVLARIGPLSSSCGKSQRYDTDVESVEKTLYVLGWMDERKSREKEQRERERAGERAISLTRFYQMLCQMHLTSPLENLHYTPIKISNSSIYSETLHFQIDLNYTNQPSRDLELVFYKSLSTMGVLPENPD